MGLFDVALIYEAPLLSLSKAKRYSYCKCSVTVCYFRELMLCLKGLNCWNRGEMVMDWFTSFLARCDSIIKLSSLFWRFSDCEVL